MTTTQPTRATAAPSARALAARAARWTLGAGVVVQLSFPFLGGGTIPLTVASVVLFAATTALHTIGVGGWRTALAVTGVVVVAAFAAEAIGVATGFPFGEYAYTDALGPQVAGVSLLVLLAWTTLAYPSWLVARRLVGAGPGRRRALARVAVTAWALTAWDVFLDPQMVAEGHWGWAFPEPSLPGTPGIPLTNYAGWLLTSAVIAVGLDAVHRTARRHWGAREVGTPATARADLVPCLVYLWTYVSCIIGNATFWERPSVALAGAVVMGVVAVPLAVVVVRERRRG